MKSFKNFFEKIKELDNKKKMIIMVSSFIALLFIVIAVVLLNVLRDKEVSMGNINNRGMVDTAGGKTYLYYYNTDVENGDNDKNGLYKISGNKVQELDKQKNVRYINASGNYIYYLVENDENKEIVKISKNGKNRTVLVDDIETGGATKNEIWVKGKNIYFIGSNNKLEVINKKGEDRKQVSNEEMLCFQIVNKDIYFISADYELKKMSLNGENVEKITNTNISSFQIYNKKIYYLNMNDEYLYEMDLDGDNAKEVIKNFVRYYNISDGYLYYNKTNEDNKMSIYRRKLNSKEDEKVVDLEGTYTYIGISGNWMYYIDKIEDNYYYYTTYRVKLNGKDKQVIKVE
ncbi:MAG: DUF5050 domain-containing protein [Clostridia bacterium]|nr:DUF5050 domain-containing protein [Clostridia bacterium]